ncbi:hypothetical protein WR25_18463 isoform C [Diploscapter pachys]|uniref:Uncharacterized protein n=1 Tax=Diploscapter pachys TaxID=2018661 RepID=A0A2A2JBG2_9BILA|nr:hypothetical protein WR25_18463 isoform C [Diploscapter pachys]
MVDAPQLINFRYRSATGAGFDQELEDMLELTHPEELIIAKLGKTASFVGIDEGEESTIGKWNSKILNKLRIQKEKDAKKDAKKKDAKKTPSDQVPASDVPINSVLSSNSFDIDLEEDIALHEDDPEDEVAEVNRVRNLVKPTNYSDTLRRKRPHSQLSSRDEELEEDDPDSFFAAPPPTKQQKMDSKGISLLQEVVDELKKKREQDHQMLTAVQSIAHLLQVHFSQISNSRSTTPPFVDLMTNPSFSPVNTPSTSNVLEPFDQGFDRLSGDYNIAKSEKWF